MPRRVENSNQNDWLLYFWNRANSSDPSLSKTEDFACRFFSGLFAVTVWIPLTLLGGLRERIRHLCASETPKITEVAIKQLSPSVPLSPHSAFLKVPDNITETAKKQLSPHTSPAPHLAFLKVLDTYPFSQDLTTQALKELDSQSLNEVLCIILAKRDDGFGNPQQWYTNKIVRSIAAAYPTYEEFASKFPRFIEIFLNGIKEKKWFVYAVRWLDPITNVYGKNKEFVSNLNNLLNCHQKAEVIDRSITGQITVLDELLIKSIQEQHLDEFKDIVSNRIQYAKFDAKCLTFCLQSMNLDQFETFLRKTPHHICFAELMKKLFGKYVPDAVDRLAYVDKYIEVFKFPPMLKLDFISCIHYEKEYKELFVKVFFDLVEKALSTRGDCSDDFRNLGHTVGQSHYMHGTGFSPHIFDEEIHAHCQPKDIPAMLYYKPNVFGRFYNSTKKIETPADFITALKAIIVIPESWRTRILREMLKGTHFSEENWIKILAHCRLFDSGNGDFLCGKLWRFFKDRAESIIEEYMETGSEKEIEQIGHVQHYSKSVLLEVLSTTRPYEPQWIKEMATIKHLYPDDYDKILKEEIGAYVKSISDEAVQKAQRRVDHRLHGWALSLKDKENKKKISDTSLIPEEDSNKDISSIIEKFL